MDEVLNLNLGGCSADEPELLTDKYHIKYHERIIREHTKLTLEIQKQQEDICYQLDKLRELSDKLNVKARLRLHLDQLLTLEEKMAEFDEQYDTV